MVSLQKVKLGNIFKLEYGKGLIAEKRTSGLYPVYGSSGCIGSHNEYLIEGPGIIVGRKGSVGEIYFSKKNFFPIDTAYYISKNDSKYNIRFLYYFLKTQNIKRLQGDVGVPGLNRETVHNEIVSYIDNLTIQARIASILSSYDELIENNEMRIKSLEEMAQLLYAEWFVKFKFPGHEKMKIIDSATEYGKIPEGWKVNRLGDFADLTMGQSPKSQHYNLENQGLPFHQGVADFGDRYPVDRVFSTSGNKFAERNDLLFSVRAPVGRMNISTKKIILGRGLSAIRHKKNFQSLLSLMFANKFTSKDMIGNGAIYKSVNRSELENLLFVTPINKIAEIFETIVTNYFQEMEKLSALNTNLSKTRDLLIPQLVTGRRELK